MPEWGEVMQVVKATAGGEGGVDCGAGVESFIGRLGMAGKQLTG